jgi:hypothetical protein
MPPLSLQNPNSVVPSKPIYPRIECEDLRIIGREILLAWIRGFAKFLKITSHECPVGV